MTLLSERILMQINQEDDEANLDNDEQVANTSEINVKFKWIPGFRKNSKIVWAYEQNMLYYVNSYSVKSGLTACTCYGNCRARLFIRKDNTAFIRKPHEPHGSHYETFMHMHCFNLLKQKATNAPASTRNLDIYNEVVKEYVFLFYYYYI